MAEQILDHDMQRQVLLKLIHHPEMGFNELWAKQGESNKFAYHIHRLEQQDLIHKTERGTYALTEEGKKFSAFVEGDTGTKAEFPTLTIIILAKDTNGQYLCQRRLKEPFYGYWGFVSGKINFGQNLFECASRDLLEEAGLVATKWKLRGFEQTKTYEEGTDNLTNHEAANNNEAHGEKAPRKLLFHHYLFIVETNNPTGTLKEKTHKAEHAWMTMEEYFKKESFPRPEFYDHIINNNRMVMLETERVMKDGKFVSARNISLTQL